MKRRYIISLALVALLLIIPGCGRDNSDDAPADAKITISPSSNTISVAAGYPLTTYTSSFTIVVKDAKGTPLNDVDVTISYPWASTSTSTGVVQFYDGVPDGGASATVSPMTATTDKNGAYTIWFTYMVGETGGAGTDLAYKGDFQVTSGSLFSSATFEITVD